MAAAPLMQIANVRVNVFHGPGKETDTFVLGGVCSSQPAEDCHLSQFLAACDVTGPTSIDCALSNLLLSRERSEKWNISS